MVKTVRRHRVLPVRHAGLDGAGIEMERRFEQLFTPHKVKMATVGCPRNCAEATVKDIGLVGRKAAGRWSSAARPASRSARRTCSRPSRRPSRRSRRRAVLPVLPRERQLPRAHLRFRGAHGIEKVRKDTVYAADTVRAALLDRFRKSKRERATPGTKGRSHSSHSVHSTRTRGQGAVMNERCWIWITPVENLPPREGRVVTVAGREIALFNLGHRVVATASHCPHKGGTARRRHRLGDSVVCPLHGWKINLGCGRVDVPRT
jgi:nitrite reductase/ring-hydroxylating ferredoxin subunit